MKKKIYIQKWKSNKKDREDHYFLKDGKMTYIFGYNPAYVTPEQFKKIRKILEI